MNPRSCHHQRTAARSSKAAGNFIGSGRLRSQCSPKVALDTLPDHTLPNGLRVKHTSTSAEVQFLYQEHFDQRVYLRNKVSLAPGAVVIDVGANIGLFAMTAAEAAGSTGLVICAEPEPQTAAALTHNIQQHAQWCAAHDRPVAPCLVVEAAVGDGSQQQAQLTVYQGASGWSTLLPDDQELMNNMEVYLGHLVEGAAQQQAGPHNTDTAAAAAAAAATGVQQAYAPGTTHENFNKQGWSALQERLVAVTRWLSGAGVPRSVSKWIARQYVSKVLMGQPQEVTVDVCTVSNIIEQHKLQRVDLLKVDVERAELDVLQGVKLHHWQLVQQVAMEVHDIDDQLQHVLHVLQKKSSFTSITSEQDPHLLGSTLYNLYATRS